MGSYDTMRKTCSLLTVFVVLLVLHAAITLADDDNASETNASVNQAPALSMTINANSGGGDLVIEANPNSGNGSTTYMLNDEKLLDKMETMDDRIKSSSEMDNYISSFILGLFVKELNFPGKKGWTPISESKLTQEQGRVRSFLEYYFVPRSELMGLLQQQEDEITQLRLELYTLQKMHTDEELCQARMLVAVEQGIKELTCGQTTYYWSERKGQFIGITSK